MRKKLLSAAMAVIVAAGLILTAMPPTASARSEYLWTWLGIKTEVHLQNVGWVSDLGGTSGESRNLEAVRLTQTGSQQICAQAHVAQIGWQNGGLICTQRPGSSITVGTTGRNLPIEALRIRLPGRTVCAKAHVRNIGWQDYRCSTGTIEVGTTGQSRAMEAIFWM